MTSWRWIDGVGTEKEEPSDLPDHSREGEMWGSKL